MHNMEPLTSQEWDHWGKMCHIFFATSGTGELYDEVCNHKSVRLGWQAIQELDAIGRNVADSPFAIGGWRLWRRAMLDAFEYEHAIWEMLKEKNEQTTV